MNLFVLFTAISICCITSEVMLFIFRIIRTPNFLHTCVTFVLNFFLLVLLSIAVVENSHLYPYAILCMSMVLLYNITMSHSYFLWLRKTQKGYL
jgi:hypothetical protein